MNIEKDEFEIEVDYSNTKRLSFYDCGVRDTFDMIEFECPSCNTKSYIQGNFEYGFGMHFSCDNCGTDVEFDDSQVEINVYAKFTNLKSLKVSNTYNYSKEDN